MSAESFRKILFQHVICNVLLYVRLSVCSWQIHKLIIRYLIYISSLMHYLLIFALSLIVDCKYALFFVSYVPYCYKLEGLGFQ